MSRIFFSVKVCSKEAHRDAFLDGNLHMNTLGYFKGYEESAAANVGDRHEATETLLQPGGFTMTLGDFTVNQADLAGPAVIQRNAHNLLNVLCLYSVHDREFPIVDSDTFEAFVDAQMMQPEVDDLGIFAAVVVNGKEFQQRVLDAIRRENFDGWAGLVDYYDPATFHGSFEAERVAFNKRKSYSHQREYRFVIYRGLEMEQAYTLQVGSLRDICVACSTSEVNELIRSYLYQMQEQGLFR